MKESQFDMSSMLVDRRCAWSRICSIRTLPSGAWQGLINPLMPLPLPPPQVQSQALSLSQLQPLGTQLNPFSLHGLVPSC